MEFYGRLQVGYFHKWEEKFAQFVLNSWKDVSLNLVKRSPKAEVEFYGQYLIWEGVPDVYG